MSGACGGIALGITSFVHRRQRRERCAFDWYENFEFYILIESVGSSPLYIRLVKPLLCPYNPTYVFLTIL
jgi:hypothetical protein